MQRRGTQGEVKEKSGSIFQVSLPNGFAQGHAQIPLATK